MNAGSRIDSQHALLAAHALLPGGWASDVLLVWDAAGALTGVTPNARGIAGVRQTRGLAVPGMPNLHSHAFQRAFAGLAEYRAGGSDDFWSWRDRMYRFAQAMTPEALEAVATQLYIEMLQAGYTSVCEFHYLHHDANAEPYADRAEMAWRLVAAAQRAGIGLTLLPVLYQSSGFGGRPPRDEQRRFVDSVDGLLQTIERLRESDARIGAAPHSLRAVSPSALAELVRGLHALDAQAPVHIHVAEQQREVDDCVAWSAARPVQWLLDHADVDTRWCLVHATHVDADESRRVAASGATVGLCPSTEANLGDGIFAAAAYADLGGRFGIGSDSHACVDAAEELRLLEYTQRLVCRRRNVLASGASPDTADALWLAAVDGGAHASGRAVAGLVPGQRADFVVLHANAAAQGLTPSQTLAGHVFAVHPQRAVLDVWVGGRCRVEQGRHPLHDDARAAFATTRKRLLDEA